MFICVANFLSSFKAFNTVTTPIPMFCLHSSETVVYGGILLTGRFKINDVMQHQYVNMLLVNIVIIYVDISK